MPVTGRTRSSAQGLNGGSLDPPFVFASTMRGALYSLTLLASLTSGCTLRSTDSSLPSRLSDEQFWTLSHELSEPAGEFPPSDNLVSNERSFPQSVRFLRLRGGAYIGVGPEQNYSYIARLEPEIAFILDIRAENRALHFLYKALFELSADRSEFLARLFSRPQPEGVPEQASVGSLFARIDDVPGSADLMRSTAQQVDAHLTTTHRFPLSEADRAWIRYVLDAFQQKGPEIAYDWSRAGPTRRPSYRALMTATDVMGASRSFLSTEPAFRTVKELHARNLIVPVVGDFGAGHALQRIAAYLQQQDARLSAFYGSNVEVYLTRQEHVTFCQRLGAFPQADGAFFIGSRGLRSLRDKLANCPPFLARERPAS